MNERQRELLPGILTKSDAMLDQMRAEIVTLVHQAAEENKVGGIKMLLDMSGGDFGGDRKFERGLAKLGALVILQDYSRSLVVETTV